MASYDFAKWRTLAKGALGHNKKRPPTARNQRRIDRKKTALKAAREMFKP
jgi:hypothetical protein